MDTKVEIYGRIILIFIVNGLIMKKDGKMNNIPRLTDLEIIIMKVLWESHAGLTIQEIKNNLKEKELSIASITQSMKHLVKKKATNVSDYVLVSNVYARSYSPCFSREEYLSAEFKRLQKSVFGTKKVNTLGIIVALMDNEGDEGMKLEEAKELQKIIDNKKSMGDEDK